MRASARNTCYGRCGWVEDGNEGLIKSEGSAMLRGAMADMLASDGGKNAFLDGADSDSQ